MTVLDTSFGDYPHSALWAELLEYTSPLISYHTINKDSMSMNFLIHSHAAIPLEGVGFTTGIHAEEMDYPEKIVHVVKNLLKVIRIEVEKRFPEWTFEKYRKGELKKSPLMSFEPYNPETGPFFKTLDFNKILICNFYNRQIKFEERYAAWTAFHTQMLSPVYPDINQLKAELEKPIPYEDLYSEMIKNYVNAPLYTAPVKNGKSTLHKNHSPTSYYSANAQSKLVEAVPALKAEVKFPCECEKGTRALADIIMHLNDSHSELSKNDIADWLESLDLDLQFKQKEVK